LCYSAVLTVTASFIWKARRAANCVQIRAGIIAVACAAAVLLTGVATDIRQSRSVDLTDAMNGLKANLPSGQRLVSFNHIDSLFAYHLGVPIEWQPWPLTAGEVRPDVEYFCFDWGNDCQPKLPINWVKIATIPVERTRRHTPERVVVVGRRLAESK
jgi:hypothetical protein